MEKSFKKCQWEKKCGLPKYQLRMKNYVQYKHLLICTNEWLGEPLQKLILYIGN